MADLERRRERLREAAHITREYDSADLTELTRLFDEAAESDTQSEMDSWMFDTAIPMARVVRIIRDMDEEDDGR